jgi:hypothetical protein
MSWRSFWSRVDVASSSPRGLADGDASLTAPLSLAPLSLAWVFAL